MRIKGVNICKHSENKEALNIMLVKKCLSELKKVYTTGQLLSFCIIIQSFPENKHEQIHF